MSYTNEIKLLKLTAGKTRAKALRLTKFFNFFVLGAKRLKQRVFIEHSEINFFIQ